ncbi:MAG: translocation/assembly module TamB domain-containing protein [Bacteroidales bacterium]|nr:translocation/assembly module TamB domain-containing protein [Bacteroidales bacterium]
MYRKKGYIVARIVGLFAILVMSSIVAIQTPYFQTRLSKLALNQLAAIMDGRVQYDELKVMTSGVLLIRNLKLIDADPYTEDINGRGWAPADTVFRAKTITATFSLTGLFRKEGIHLGRVTIEDGYFHLTAEPGEYKDNLSRIFRLKPTGKPMTRDNIFDIKKFRINNFRFRMTSFLPDKGHYKGFGINYEDLDVTADITGHNLKMVDAKMFGTLDRLSAREKSGYSIEQLGAIVEVGQGRALIEDLRLRDPWTNLSMRTLAMHFDNAKAFSNFVEEVRLEGDFLRSQFALTSLSYLAGAFIGSPSVADIRRGRVNGPVCDLLLDRLSFTDLHSGVSIVLDGRITGLPDLANLTLDTQIRDLTGTTAAFSRCLAGITVKRGPAIGQFARGIPLTLQLQAQGPVARLDVNGKMTSSLGDFDVNGILYNLFQSGRPLETSLNIGTRELDLGRILNTDVLGPVTLRTRAHASLRPGLPDAGIDSLHIEKFHALGRDFHHIRLSGTLLDGTARGRIQSLDPALRLDLNGLADLSPHKNGSRYRLSGHIDDIDLAAIGVKGGLVSHISTGILANLIQKDGRFDGMAQLQNLVLTNGKGSHTFGDIRVDAETREQEQHIQLNAPFLEARFRGDEPIGDFVQDVQNVTLRRDLSALYPTPQTEAGSGNYQVELDFRDTRELLALILPGLYLADGTQLRLAVQDDILTGRITSDRLALGTNYLRKVDVRLDNEHDALSAHLVSTEMRAGTLAMSNPSITLGADDNALSLGAHYDSFAGAAGEAALHLDGQVRRDADGVLEVWARPLDSYLTTGEDTWNFGESSILLHGKDLHLDHLSLNNGPQRLIVNGGFSREKVDTLSLLMDRFDLALVDEFLPSRIGIEGKMNGSATVSSGQGGVAGMLMDFRIDTLRVGGAEAGALQLTSDMHDEGREVGLRIRDVIDGQDVLEAEGSYHITDKLLDARIHFDVLPLNVAASFLTQFVSELDGGISGEIRLAGPLDDLTPYSENLRIEDAHVRVAATTVPYTIAGPLRVNAEGLYLDGVSIRDLDGGTCDINASLLFKRFRDFSLDGRLKLSGFKLLDTPERPGFPAYGLLRASGTASARGPFNNLTVDADLSTAGDGQVHIPLSGSLSSAKQSSLLTFTQPPEDLDPYEQMIAGLKTKSVKGSDINIRGHVNILPAVRAFIEIDKAAGNIASVSGQGSVNINLRPSRAIFDLNGDYTISEGNYQFVMPGVLSKTFNVERGSSIRFGGDIQNTELDLTATYGLRTTLDPILATGSNSRRQVNCLLHVTDRLRAPSVNLDIEVPDLDPTTRTEVESALNTADKVQKQFVSLLLLGSFLPDESSGVFNQSNLLLSNITEMMAGQINNILQRLEIPIDVGFGYQEMRTGENLFDISLSTQLFEDRVLLGGNFGNRRYSTGTTVGDFTGNLDLQVKLDPEGKFRFNVFSHAADEFTSYLDFSQRNGIGVSYQKEYRTFQELLRHLTVPAKKRAPYELEEAEKQLKQVIINIQSEPRQTLPDSGAARRRRAGRDSTAVRP